MTNFYIMKNLIITLIIVLIFIYGLFNDFHPLVIGLLGAINILNLSIYYINLFNKDK